MCLTQRHNAKTLVRLEPAPPRSRVMHSLWVSHISIMSVRVGKKNPSQRLLIDITSQYWQLCFLLLIARRRVGFQNLSNPIQFLDLSKDERIRALCFVCSRAHQGLTVGFHLLQYSVVYNVESLSLFYLLVIS